MADVLSPSLFSSTYPKSPFPPQSKLFEPAPPSDKSSVIQPHERPSTASGISRPGFTKSGDGSDLTMSQPTLQRYRRHREYYIDGGDIVFLVSLPSNFTILNRPSPHKAMHENRSRTCFFACIGGYPPPESQILVGFSKSVADNSYFFERESPVFRKQLAGYGTRERPGGSDADPCVLEGVTVEDFSRFLWVFYNQ
jgi:hypothetical protein